MGIALKPYLIVVLPLWLSWDRRWSGLVLAFAPSALAASAMSLLIGTEWVDAYAFQGSREVSVEAGPAVVAGLLGAGSVGLDQACLCFVRTSIDPAGALGTAFALLALGGVYRRFRRADADGLVRASLAGVGVLLLFAPVFSPQYLVWLLPVAALIGGRTLWLAAAAGLTGFLAYPLLYPEVLDGQALAVLLARLILLAALVGNLASGGEKRPAAP